jgi:hypothetical protein
MTDQLLRPHLAYLVRVWAEPTAQSQGNLDWRVSVQRVNGADHKGFADLESAMTYIAEAMAAEDRQHTQLLLGETDEE